MNDSVLTAGRKWVVLFIVWVRLFYLRPIHKYWIMPGCYALGLDPVGPSMPITIPIDPHELIGFLKYFCAAISALLFAW